MSTRRGNNSNPLSNPRNNMGRNAQVALTRLGVALTRLEVDIIRQITIDHTIHSRLDTLKEVILGAARTGTLM